MNKDLIRKYHGDTGKNALICIYPETIFNIEAIGKADLEKVGLPDDEHYYTAEYVRWLEAKVDEI